MTKRACLSAVFSWMARCSIPLCSGTSPTPITLVSSRDSGAESEPFICPAMPEKTHAGTTHRPNVTDEFCRGALILLRKVAGKGDWLRGANRCGTNGNVAATVPVPIFRLFPQRHAGGPSQKGDRHNPVRHGDCSHPAVCDEVVRERPHSADGVRIAVKAGDLDKMRQRPTTAVRCEQESCRTGLGQAPYILCKVEAQHTTSGSQSPFPDSL